MTTKNIRYQQFGLCAELEKIESAKLPRVYSLDMLANKWESDKKNIISACYENDNLTAFINLTSDVRLQERESLSPITNISGAPIQMSYKYPLKNYAQLAKYPKIEQQISLKYFYTNETLKRTIDHATSVAIVPPLCKQVMGISQFIEVLRTTKPILYFMREYVHEYEKTKNFLENFPRNKAIQKQGTQLSALHETIKTIPEYWTKNVQAIWNELQQFAYAGHPVVLDVDDYSEDTPKISWRAHNKKECEAGPKRLSNILSDLKL